MGGFDSWDFPQTREKRRSENGDRMRFDQLMEHGTNKHVTQLRVMAVELT